nr:integrase, catalytic region, zinc finger, CCHC-type, peptidase aspartic, catalytic [Tanacetum cinerariifolium]
MSAKRHKFNFSKYISESLVRNVDSSSKFYMYHRVGKACSGVETPLFEGMLVVGEPEEHGDAEEQGTDDNATQGPNTAVSGDDVEDQFILSPTLTTSPPQQPQDIPSTSQEALDACTALTRRVEHLEHDKVAQNLEITKLKIRVKKLERANKVKALKLRRLRKVGTSQRVNTSNDTIMEDVSTQGRMIEELDKDEGAVLMNEKEEEKKPKEDDKPEVQEVVKVVTTAKLITEVVAAISEAVSAASANIVAVVVPATTIIAALVKVVVASTRRRRGVVIRDPEEKSFAKTPTETKSKDKGKGIMVEEPKPMKKKKQRYQVMKKRPQTEAQARKNMIMYLKNTTGFRLDYFKGMSYDDIHPIFKAKFNSNIEFLLKSKEKIEEEENRALESINETPVQKAAKRRRLNEEAEDVEKLKQHLEIVPDEDDDVYTKATLLARKVPVVDYQTIQLNNKPHFKFIRADGTHRLYEKEAKLFNEWERFTSNDEELIESYYHRFLKLMNDLKRNKHFLETVASNLKFLNNLQPEWSQHVTIVHQTKDLHTADYTQLYNFLKYNQKENLNGNGNLVVARAEENAAGHIGNQIRCYNCRGVADLDEIEEVNVNCILMANLQQASTLGTQTDKAPVYDSDGSAEVHDYENCYDNEIFNMFTQEEQYAKLREPIHEPHQVTQNDNNVIYESVYQEQCLSKKINALHLSFDKLLMTLNEEISDLNKQLLKEKSTVLFFLEEKKKSKSDFKTREDELLDIQIQLEKKIKELNNILVKTGQSIQTIHMLSPKPDSFYHTEQKMALGYQNPFYLKQALKKQQSLYNGKVLLEKHDPPVVHDSEETLQLAQESRQKMKQLNKEIKLANYTKINHLLGVFVSQTAMSREELYFLNDSKTANVSKSISVPNEEFSDDTTPSVARKFLNETFREQKDVPNNVRASTRTKPITISQPPVITKKDVNSDSEGLSSTGVDNTKTRRPQPRSNTTHDKVPSASKSSRSKNKEAEVKEHHRNLLLSKNNKHISFACNNIKIDSQNVISKVVCAMWNILITRVYFVKGLGHNLFSVGQFCDSDLEVAFRRNACFVRNLEGVDLLKGDRSTNLYTINLHEMAYASPICLMARASSTKSWLWHQRLSHLNFDTINDLAKNDIVSGLPKFKYHKEHHCPSYEQGKSTRASHPPEPVPNSRQRTKNQTLVEAARTMLIFSRAPLFLWAEAIATAYFTQNRSIIHCHFNQTPYELINDRKLDISFLHVFGALCYPKNDGEDIGKLGSKGDIGFFIGYSADSYAYRFYNRRTKKIMEAMNVSFDELSAMAFEQRSLKPGLQSMTFGQISSRLDLTYALSIITSQQPTEGELDLLFKAMYDDFIGASKESYPSPTASAADNVLNAVFEGDLFVNPFATPSTEFGVSSTQYVDPSNMHTFYQPYPHDYQWTKDHPLEQVIGEPSRLVLTRNQLKTDGNMYGYALTFSIMEPKSVKEALTDSAWIAFMQEELHQFIRLEVLELVPHRMTSNPLL